ncbi:hypothetical protein SAMN04244572_02993 [Azotobacter beijerinckii]|uniref:Glycine zipper n=1 Tax=Azotobacter beijerinckii TaxID=170623 RepID=A0A1H6R3D1_9GAMM|nr:hypothetical protein [Azotobacter beijerinckii]SEI46290.1 hypothetical protein SAMN04244579_00604 [Azotobacter beijerinckii]SEJ17051.1 hypothetical protein SAMN04244572_02993 [Azotobacter beijerinckii]
MKKPRALALTLSLLAIEGVPLAKAGDEPGSEKQAAGKSLGGMNGMMIGAIGGPIGMLVGAGVGLLVGDGAEEVAKDALSDTDKSQPAESAASGKTITR